MSVESKPAASKESATTQWMPFISICGWLFAGLLSSVSMNNSTSPTMVVMLMGGVALNVTLGIYMAIRAEMRRQIDRSK